MSELSPAERWEGALCAQVGMPDMWFPEKGGSTEGAKRVCARCPIETRAECLEYALETKQRFGIWGGVSERDRRKIEVERGEAA